LLLENANEILAVALVALSKYFIFFTSVSVNELVAVAVISLANRIEIVAEEEAETEGEIVGLEAGNERN